MADAIAGATGNSDAGLMAGNMVANILAGAGGALVGGGGGAFAAANVDRYNRSDSNGSGTGPTGTGSFLQSLVPDSVADALDAANKKLDSLANQFVGLMNANSGQTPPADANPLVDANNNSTPPATGGAVVTPPFMVCTPNLGCVTTPSVATPGTAGYVPGTATLNSGNDGDSSSLVDGGGLQAHEDAGGHLLEKHVGQSEQDLATRLVNEPQISGSSSFPDRATAERVVSQTLDANQSTITNWLAGSSNRLSLNYSSSDPTGISVAKGTSGAMDVNSARVVLVRDPSMSTGYRVLTGYPTKP